MVADCHALVGDADGCLDWLRSAVDRGLINFPLLAQFDPFLESVRGSAAFESLLDEVEVRWKALEV